MNSKPLQDHCLLSADFSMKCPISMWVPLSLFMMKNTDMACWRFHRHHKTRVCYTHSSCMACWWIQSHLKVIVCCVLTWIWSFPSPCGFPFLSHDEKYLHDTLRFHCHLKTTHSSCSIDCMWFGMLHRTITAGYYFSTGLKRHQTHVLFEDWVMLSGLKWHYWEQILQFAGTERAVQCFSVYFQV